MLNMFFLTVRKRKKSVQSFGFIDFLKYKNRYLINSSNTSLVIGLEI